MGDVVANIKKNVTKLSAKKSDADNESSSSSTSSSSGPTNADGVEIESEATWESLGVTDSLCQAVRQMKWNKPSKIQKEAIPPALQVGFQAWLVLSLVSELTI